MSLAGWLNTAWMLKSLPEAWAFRRATRHIAGTQAAVLAEILRPNRDTEFGRAHAFGRLRAPRDYQERVPLARPQDVAEAVRRIGEGQPRVLTAERVTLLQPTSGTTGAEKLIPYTATLRRQFQRAVAAWVADLFASCPAVRRGRAYWSISPALGEVRRTPAGIPVGFDDDSAYLGTLERKALERLLVVPPAVARLGDMDTFRYATLVHLLRAGDLALVSVWNPTFLTALLAPLEGWQQRLVRDMRDGTLRPPTPLPDSLVRRVAPRRPDPRRADHLAAIFRRGLSAAETFRLVWPRLALISCWADAAAGRCLAGLRELFPDVSFQPKGLLATEGCVSFPLWGRPAAVLAVRSHFFEFQETDGLEARARCRLAHELDRGGRYRVILTTGGGLYRYPLRDEVEVAGFEHRCPLVRFRGKCDRVSDLVGEKLAEPHVRAVLDRLFAGQSVSPRFALLVPVEGRPARYRLYLQDPRLPPQECGPGLAEALEAGLGENLYYRHAVRLGQLAPAEVNVLDPAAEPAWHIYERRCLALGQKAGDVKPTALDSWTGWPELFAAAGRGAAVQRS
jgi:hypothetical protein